jgi:NAD(P)-dependent dehydrogenase (short-subunit alcohol dehydrogenase family)
MASSPSAGTLKARHALVTGGGSGIGAAIAAALAGEGMRLTLLGRDAAKLERTAVRLRSQTQVTCVAADVADAAQVTMAFATARSQLGPVDILVNNAGAAESAPFVKTGPELWQRMLAVNLTGAYHCCREVVPDMVKAGYGRIVMIASIAGLQGYPYVSAYCAAKHGVVGLTRALALETARAGVTVNAICPGYVDTEMTEATLANITAKTGRSREDALKALVEHNPQGRLIAPEEIVAAVLYLCRPGSESVTGQAIALAGGEVMR